MQARQQNKQKKDVLPHREQPEKTFRDAQRMFLQDAQLSGDVSLAGFILQHCLGAGPLSIGWIGLGPEAELLALNAIVAPDATFVVLNTATREPSQSKRHLPDVTNKLDTAGFAVRLQVADLTLPGRWPKLLLALAAGNMGVVGLDARWARSEPQFWENLSTFVRSTGAVVYIRGLLDIDRPDVSIEFLRTMPGDSGLDVFAATRASVWFAPVGTVAAAMRKALRSSGLFRDFGSKTAELDGETPVIVRGDDAARFVGDDGRFPRAVYRGQDDEIAGIHFGDGWSPAEPDGRWTEGAEATITLTPPSEGPLPKRLVIVGNPWMPPDKPVQVVALGFGHRPKEWTEVRFTADEIKAEPIDFQQSDLLGGTLLLRVRVESPGRPSDHGGADSRVLGFKFRDLRLFT